jgi:ferric-dicitrate binding protein FerR (iron transport regulator)
MKVDITRDVVSDLWSLCRSGEASADSRALVDAFLSKDDDFASTLRESEKLSGAIPALRLSPDAERRLLDDARKRARTKLVVIGGAIGMAGLVMLTALGALLWLVLGRGLLGTQ